MQLSITKELGMKDIIHGVIGVLLVCLFTYGMYYIFKSVSYNLFYEDMVKDTVLEVLKSKQLIN
jgi:hypothetical protein